MAARLGVAGGGRRARGGGGAAPPPSLDDLHSSKAIFSSDTGVLHSSMPTCFMGVTKSSAIAAGRGRGRGA